MQLLVIKLTKEELLEDIITAMTAVGIEEAVVTESSTIQQFMGQNIPIFAGLRTETRRGGYCKMIAAKISDKAVLEELKSILSRAMIDLNDEDTGAAFVIPCEEF